MTSQWSASGVSSGVASLGTGRDRSCPTCGARYPGDFNVCPRDATPLVDTPEAADPLLGMVLADAFQVVRLIGEGGMARVYEARHVRLPNKRFAVKVLLPAQAQNGEVVLRFQREAEAASGIGHPNVVDVYDVHRMPDGTPYLVCEYLDGKDLASLLDQRGKIEVPLAIAIVRQLCRALAAAHERGVVHRDVKPENVFLVGNLSQPVVKVIDFGISKVDAGGGASLTRTGMIMGTPAYMPPEQARGARVDHRADVYGVGAILYRALTGQLPFDYDDAAEALSAVLTSEPPRPRSVAPEIPPALELVIQRAMAKEPAQRHAHMLELDADLEPFDAELVGPLEPTVPVASASSPSSPAGPVSPTGATILSAGPIPATKAVRPRVTSVALERVAREAQWARPKLVLLTLAATVWGVLLVLDALSSLVQATRPGTGLSMAEGLLVLLGGAALAVTPLVFWVRYLVRAVWGNSVRCVALANTLTWATLAAVVGYGVVVQGLRLLALVGVWPDAAASPFASPTLLLASLAAAGFATVLSRAER